MIDSSERLFTCSKSTNEITEQDVKSVESQR